LALALGCSLIFEKESSFATAKSQEPKAKGLPENGWDAESKIAASAIVDVD
jgi:hypothetical protein